MNMDTEFLAREDRLFFQMSVGRDTAPVRSAGSVSYAKPAPWVQTGLIGGLIRGGRRCGASRAGAVEVGTVALLNLI